MGNGINRLKDPILILMFLLLLMLLVLILLLMLVFLLVVYNDLNINTGVPNAINTGGSCYVGFTAYS